ncbi:MAG: hypothetical protein ACKVU2_17720 [Saprospiraceae bacterium]
MSANSNSRVYGFVVTLLLLISGAAGWFFWQKTKKTADDNAIQRQMMDSLALVKTGIERELDSLSLAYSGLRTENENLQGQVTTTAALIEQKEIVIKQIKTAAAKDASDLEKQVADLSRIKTEFETIMLVLRQENQKLREENDLLMNKNTQLEGQVTNLAKQLEEQIQKTQSATFKASSFRVEVELRNDKLTVRASRARELLISFDLADVPQQFHGPQKLYLSVTDDKGTPIVINNPIKATVYAPTGPVEIVAQQVKQVVLETTQRLSIAHKLEEKLKAGNYVAAVYCDKGLLGASSFRLR